jgi:hypothetical protein
MPQLPKKSIKDSDVGHSLRGGIDGGPDRVNEVKNAVGQWRYGVCLQKGDGISKDLRGTLIYGKLAAGERNSKSQ